jgi:ribosomal-protein-alanine N-acetyltransferase
MDFLVMAALIRLISRFSLPRHDLGNGQLQMIDSRTHLTQHGRNQGQAARESASRRSVTHLHLGTDRLELRALSLGDLDEMASLLGDAEALIYWVSPLSREESRGWIERNLKRYDDAGFGRCAVILRSTGELVGDCGLIQTLVEGRPEVELGWIVRRRHQGKGIATEAAAAWRDYAFDTLGLERIVSMVSEANVASRRVAEKLGMTVEREAMWGDLPHLMYSIHRDRHRAKVRDRSVPAEGRGGETP